MITTTLSISCHLYLLYFITRFCKPKKPKTLIFHTIVVYSFCCVLFINQLTTISFSILFLSALYTCCFLCIGTWKKKVILFIIGLFILITSCFFGIVLLSSFGQLNWIMTSQISGILLIIITFLFNYMSGSWIIRFHKCKKQEKNSLYIAYPLCMLLLFAMFIGTSFQQSILAFLYFLIIIIAFLSLIAINDKLVDNKIYGKEKEVERLKENEVYLQSKYDFLSYTLDKNASYFHDLLQFFSALTTQIQKQEYDTALAAIEQEAQKTTQLFSEVYTNSPLLSTLIIENEEAIKASQITIVSTIRDKRMTTLSLVDETALLESLFQTAITSCKECHTAHKKIIIKGEDLGLQKILKFSFSANKDTALIEKLQAQLCYTDTMDIHYNEQHDLLEILLLFKIQHKEQEFMT